MSTYFLLQPGGRPDVTALGWQVDDHATFETIRLRADAGLPVTGHEECTLRGDRAPLALPRAERHEHRIFTAATTSRLRCGCCSPVCHRQRRHGPSPITAPRTEGIVATTTGFSMRGCRTGSREISPGQPAHPFPCGSTSAATLDRRRRRPEPASIRSGRGSNISTPRSSRSTTCSLRAGHRPRLPHAVERRTKH